GSVVWGFRRRLLGSLAVAAACAFGLGGPAAAAQRATAPRGGTLRVITPIVFPSLDPALTKPAVRFYWYATCATLMAFRDEPAPPGVRIRPEAAAGSPKISHAGRTYVFRVRRGWRFSDGSPLTAANFARGLARVMNPVMGSPGAGLFSDVARVTAKGLRLRIDLNQADADLPM